MCKDHFSIRRTVIAGGIGAVRCRVDIVEVETLFTFVTSRHVAARLTHAVTSSHVIATRPSVAVTPAVCNIQIEQMIIIGVNDDPSQSGGASPAIREHTLLSATWHR